MTQPHESREPLYLHPLLPEALARASERLFGGVPALRESLAELATLARPLAPASNYVPAVFFAEDVHRFFSAVETAFERFDGYAFTHRGTDSSQRDAALAYVLARHLALTACQWASVTQRATPGFGLAVALDVAVAPVG